MFTVLVLGVLLLRDARVQPLAGVEDNFIDWLSANGSGEHSRAPVTLVEINDNCLLNYTWPWSPLNYALFLTAALQFQARAVAIEPVLAWDPSKLSPIQLLQQPQFEKILHDAILRTPKVALGAQLGFPEDPDVLPPMQPLPILTSVTGAMDAVPEYTVVEAEPGEDIRLTAALGFSNVPPSEPTARHAPLIFRYRGQIVASFALQAMMLWHGVTPDQVDVRLGSEIRLGDKLAIPVNQAGAMLVDWEQPFDRVGFDDLVLAEDQLQGRHAMVIDPAILKDRLLILARTDAQSRTLPLPTGQVGSSGELWAEALATAETGAFARPAGHLGNATVLLLGLALSWVVASRRRLLMPPILAGFAAGYLLICLGVFQATRVALPLTPMLGLALFVGLFRLLTPGEERNSGRS
jgi:CHASE2 domain-containing sensor protein